MCDIREQLERGLRFSQGDDRLDYLESVVGILIERIESLESEVFKSKKPIHADTPRPGKTTPIPREPYAYKQTSIPLNGDKLTYKDNIIKVLKDNPQGIARKSLIALCREMRPVFVNSSHNGAIRELMKSNRVNEDNKILYYIFP